MVEKKICLRGIDEHDFLNLVSVKNEQEKKKITLHTFNSGGVRNYSFVGLAKTNDR